MLNSIQYNILKDLSNSDGIVNISPELSKYFPVANTNESHELHIELGKLKVFLDLLEKDGLITFERFKMGSGNTSNGYSWLHNTPVLAAITNKGREAIQKRDIQPKEEMLLDLTIDVHNSTLDMNSFMKVYVKRQFLWPLLISALSLIAAVVAIVLGAIR